MSLPKDMGAIEELSSSSGVVSMMKAEEVDSTMDHSSYVAVSESETEDPIEVPIEHDGGLLLTSVQSQFPSAVGLKFRNPSNRSFRGVRLAEGVLYPPEGGWGEMVYLVNTAKTQTDNKRKMEDSAQAEVSKTKRPTPQSSDLVVLNLPYHYSKENLIDYFSKHGDIAFAQIMKNTAGESRGFAFIRFVNYDDQKRVNGCHFVIDGRKVHVKKPASQAPELCKVFVGRLTAKITKEDLMEHFEQFGPVSEIFYDVGRKQYGFVTFDESSTAERALLQKAHYIKDTHVVVRPAEPVDKSKQSPQSGTTATSNVTGNNSPYSGITHSAPYTSPHHNSNASPYYSSPPQPPPFHPSGYGSSDKFAPPSPYDGYSVPSPMSTSSSIATSRPSYQPQPPPLPPINHQPMSPSGMHMPPSHPPGTGAPPADPGVFGQEMLTAMAKMMATAMSTGAFNSAVSHANVHHQQQTPGAMGLTPHHQHQHQTPPHPHPPPPMGATRMNSYDSHSSHTFRVSHQSSSSMPTQHQSPQNSAASASGAGAYRYPTVAMTNPYRSPPHDPYNNMY
ncbi:uncharacterized protein LOC142348168 [Convolutriloba macropyga]|uniref:uncharacterized protein LOC142348168 n=1 Tax=Convolutriloba macropyga TaxID=536237 RepID=UPI003F52614F